MSDWARPLAERGRVDAVTFAAEVVGGDTPVVLRGQVADWLATAPFNILVNCGSEREGGEPPLLALVHALMAVRDLPGHERRARRVAFDHYVFGEEAMSAADHLPEPVRGLLGPPSVARVGRIRQFLLRALARR